MEKPLFFENRGLSQFGMLYVPEDYNNKGIIICSPFDRERRWSYRVMVNFARLLASRGYAVFRFDYRGTGESDGDNDFPSLESRIEDIAAATIFFKSQVRIEKLSLLGLRMGATAAILSAGGSDLIDSLALWYPILDLKKFIYGYLRENLTTQLKLYKKIKYTRDQLIERILQGEKINISGFYVTPRYYQETISINVEEQLKKIKKPMLGVEIAKKGNPTPYFNYLQQLKSELPNLTLARVVEWNFWDEIKFYYTWPESLFQKTLDWLESNPNNSGS